MAGERIIMEADGQQITAQWTVHDAVSQCRSVSSQTTDMAKQRNVSQTF